MCTMTCTKGKRKFVQYKTLKCILFATILVLLLVVFYLSKSSIMTRSQVNRFPEPNDQSNHKFMGEKLVHLDLKGAPPKVSYYKQIFPIFAQMGATGLLIEYEDMFPYSGGLSYISAKNAYTLKEIEEINALAFANNLKIIPLVQTFGHLGFLLKLPQFKHLREVEYPQVICPTHNQTLPLLNSMITQLLKWHPHSKEIHIGCDEVFHIGVCNRCEEVIIRNKWSGFDLYLDHVKALAKHIKSLRKNITVLIWDDILRNIEEDALYSSQISQYVTPVVWKYTPYVYQDIPESIWDKYVNVFPRLWIASAFKGASGSNEIITESAYHVNNHVSWMQVVNDYKSLVKFQGILITGWQRYDHFAVLCELLPMGIPSLDMCLWTLDGSDKTNYPIDYQLPTCNFPGGKIIFDILAFRNLQAEFVELTKDSRVKGWMTDYNIKYGFSNPEYVAEISRPLEKLTMELMNLKDSLYRNLLDVYDNYTVIEWMETYVDPFRNQLYDLWDKKEKLLEKSEWSRRPYYDEN